MKTNNISKVSTKTGDQGLSSDYSGNRQPKDAELFEALGTIDELSSWLGICFHKTNNSDLNRIQTDLQKLSSMIATNPDHPNYLKLQLITVLDIEWLENNEALIMENIDLDNRFILPGTDCTEAGAWLDLARAVARRAERRFFAFQNTTKRTDLELCGSYLNRLSDLLFLMARTKR
jgi:cob(I)alamin adenosyltransferase